MVQQLFVALDGSGRSLTGLPVAAALARRAGARVTAVSVTPPWRDAGDVLGWLDQNVDPEVATTMAIIADDPAGSLLELVDDEPASVLCMTSHGRTGVSELALGSVTSAVVRASRRPVLVVGPRARPAEAFDVIAACVHGPPARIAATVAEWSVALRATPWMCAVQDPDDVLADDTPAGAELRTLERLLRDAGAVPEPVVLHAHDAVPSLLGHADAVGAALLVAATEARRGVDGLLLGSVAKRLVREAPCPVVLVGPSVPVDPSAPAHH